MENKRISNRVLRIPFLHVLELVQIRQIIINLKLQNDGKFQKRTKLHFFAL